MAWDSELEDLVNRVVRDLGREALTASIERAFNKTTARALQIQPLPGESLEAGVIDYYEALRAELRRLLRPN